RRGVRDPRRHGGRAGGHLPGPVRGGVWPTVRLVAEGFGTAGRRDGRCNGIGLSGVSAPQRRRSNRGRNETNDEAHPTRGDKAVTTPIIGPPKTKERDRDGRSGRLPLTTPAVVSAQEWEAARQQLLVKEKALTRARDALAAERRRMPWLAVEKAYEFDGPNGK